MEKFIILTVRRLEHRMGLINLIYAINLLKDKIDNFFLIIGGQGTLKNHIQDLIQQLHLSPYIRLEGFIEEDKLAYYYQVSDLFVLPTEFLEGFGLIILESLACGTPVIGTPVGSIPEILSKVNKEFITKNNRTNDLAEGIYNFYKCDQSNKKYSTYYRSIVEKYYDWELSAIKLETNYNKILDSQN